MEKNDFKEREFYIRKPKNKCSQIFTIFYLLILVLVAIYYNKIRVWHHLRWFLYLYQSSQQIDFSQFHQYINQDHQSIFSSAIIQWKASSIFKKWLFTIYIGKLDLTYDWWIFLTKIFISMLQWLNQRRSGLSDFRLINISIILDCMEELIWVFKKNFLIEIELFWRYE